MPSKFSVKDNLEDCRGSYLDTKGRLTNRCLSTLIAYHSNWKKSSINKSQIFTNLNNMKYKEIIPTFRTFLQEFKSRITTCRI